MEQDTWLIWREGYDLMVGYRASLHYGTGKVFASKPVEFAITVILSIIIYNDHILFVSVFLLCQHF